ncbi:MAG: hypothetical protein KME11_10105 [Timaviella obliquedivisa GSE-PSE-MK23-08B]|nr:hypothetical protein [Timaviella obliquedivisa GSE-PSE-MK23-08B]
MTRYSATVTRYDANVTRYNTNMTRYSAIAGRFLEELDTAKPRDEGKLRSCPTRRYPSRG